MTAQPTITEHAEQQLYIADLRSKGVNDGGILALLALRWTAKAAKAALRFELDQTRHRIPTPAEIVASRAGTATHDAATGAAALLSIKRTLGLDSFDADDSGAQEHVAPADSYRGFFERAQPVATAVAMVFVLGSIVPAMVWCLCEGRLS